MLARRACVYLYGSEGWGFESLRARPGQRPLPIAEGAFLLTLVLTAATGFRHDLDEDAGGRGMLVAHHVGGSRRVIDGSAWPSREATTCTLGTGQQQRRRVDMTQIMQPT